MYSKFVLILAVVIGIVAGFGPQAARAQAEPEAEKAEHRVFLPTILNPFTGSVLLNCPTGSDATVNFQALTPFPGLVLGVWTLYNESSGEGAIHTAGPYVVMGGYGAAVFNLHHPDWSVMSMEWASTTPLVVTGSGCFSIDDMPIPPN